MSSTRLTNKVLADDCALYGSGLWDADGVAFFLCMVVQIRKFVLEEIKKGGKSVKTMSTTVQHTLMLSFFVLVATETIFK